MARHPISALIRPVLRKLRGIARLPPGFVLLTGVAWLGLWLARVVILLVPLRHSVRLYGQDWGLAACLPLADPDQMARADRIRRALQLAVKYSPASANCYPQALVARFLLARAGLPHALFFGVRREGAELKAHAWVMIGRLAVSGGDCFGTYTVVRSFFSPPPGPAGAG